MGEKARVNTALAILGLTGTAVLFSAVEQSFKVPPELWGLATAASVYLFSTARREIREQSKDEDDA